MKEDKIMKNCNSSGLPWEEATAHSFGTTALVYNLWTRCPLFMSPFLWPPSAVDLALHYVSE